MTFITRMETRRCDLKNKESSTTMYSNSMDTMHICYSNICYVRTYAYSCIETNFLQDLINEADKI